MSFTLYQLVKTIPAAILIVAVCCASQKASPVKPNKQYQHKRDTYFKGRVKSINDFNFKRYAADSGFFGYESKMYLKFDRAGNLLEKITYRKDEKFSSRSVYRYNSAGNYIEWKSFSENDSLISKQTFQFDKEGNMIKTVKYRGPSFLIETNNYYYDEHGSMIELCKEGDAFRMSNTYTYDSLNRPLTKERIDFIRIKKKKTSCYETKTKKYSYTYKYSGDTTEETHKDNYKGYTRTVWNKNNRLLVRQGLDGAEKGFEETYKYDPSGNEIEYKELKDGIIDNNRSYRCEYVYDKKGNWIKKTTTSPDGKPRCSVERKIEYY